MILIALLCSSLAGSPFRDHCREEPIVLHDVTPQTCYLGANSVLAEKKTLWPDDDIRAFRCQSRKH